MQKENYTNLPQMFELCNSDFHFPARRQKIRKGDIRDGWREKVSVQKRVVAAWKKWIRVKFWPFTFSTTSYLRSSNRKFKIEKKKKLLGTRKGLETMFSTMEGKVERLEVITSFILLCFSKERVFFKKNLARLFEAINLNIKDKGFRKIKHCIKVKTIILDGHTEIMNYISKKVPKGLLLLFLFLGGVSIFRSTI